MEQMTMFTKPHTEFDSVWEAIVKMRTSNDKVRKRLFAEVTQLQKDLVKVQAENERLKFHTEMKPVLRWTA